MSQELVHPDVKNPIGHIYWPDNQFSAMYHQGLMVCSRQQESWQLRLWESHRVPSISSPAVAEGREPEPTEAGRRTHGARLAPQIPAQHGGAGPRGELGSLASPSQPVWPGAQPLPKPGPWAPGQPAGGVGERGSGRADVDHSQRLLSTVCRAWRKRAH